MVTHSSVLAWRVPGTGEPGGLPSMGSHRVGHNWSDLAAAAASWVWVWNMKNLGAPNSTLVSTRNVICGEQGCGWGRGWGRRGVLEEWAEFSTPGSLCGMIVLQRACQPHTPNMRIWCRSVSPPSSLVSQQPVGILPVAEGSLEWVMEEGEDEY